MSHEVSPGIRRSMLAAVALLAVVVALFAFSASAQAQTVYDSIPNPIPANVPSLGFEATQTSELGDHIAFTAGTSRQLKSVTILMSSWACESGDWNAGDCTTTTPGATFSHPITLNIYAADTSGAQPAPVAPALLSKTVVFNIPFRPSSSPVECKTGVTPTSDGTQWWDAATSTCNNGLATKIVFDFSADPSIVLPDEVIFGVAYNTQTYGAEPIGTNGHYNSLNVGLLEVNPTWAGTDLDLDMLFWDTDTASNYSDGGAAGVGIFRFDTGWSGYSVNAAFEMEPLCTTACYVNAATGNDAFGGASPDRAKKTIQAALDTVSAGGTVHVAGGEYVEQLTISSKDLTLQGAGAGTIIKSPATLATQFVLSSRNRKPVVFVQNALVTIKDLVVDGDGRGNGNVEMFGVAYLNAGGAIENVEIMNVMDTPFSGAQHGVALYAMVNDGSTKTLDVKSANFHNFQKNGTSFSSDATSNFTVNMLDSTVTGAGSTAVTGQNGIQYYQVGGTLMGMVSGNTISGIAYDNTASTTKWLASSILNFYADLDIVGNTITGAHAAIYNYDGSARILDNTVGVIHAAPTSTDGYGIIATDPPSAVPSPYVDDAAVATAAESMVSGAALSVISVDVSGNNISFSGTRTVTPTIGIEVDAGWGADLIEFRAITNTVDNFDYGFAFGMCASPDTCYAGALRFAEVHYNSILNSKIAGISSAAGNPTIQAQNNWWGVATGPVAPNGTIGDVVTDPFLTAAPTAIILFPNTVAEMALSGTEVGTLVAPDSDSFAATFSECTTPVNGDKFDVAVDKVKTAAVFDYETMPHSFQYCVKADEGPGGIIEQNVTINVTDVNDAPTAITLAPGTVAEMASSGAEAGTLTAADPDGNPATFSECATPVNGDKFDVDGGKVKTVAVFDYETLPNSFQYCVKADDGRGGILEQNVTINVTDVNEAPTAITLAPGTVAEMALSGTEVGTLTAADLDGNAATFSECATPVNGDKFDVAGGKVKTAAVFDYETMPHSFQYCVKADDGRGGILDQNVTINVTDVNEAPTAISLSDTEFATTLDNKFPASTFMADFVVTDAEAPAAPFVCVIDTQPTGGYFQVVSGDKLHSDAAIPPGLYSIGVHCTDSGGMSSTVTQLWIVVNGAGEVVDLLPNAGATLTFAPSDEQQIEISVPAGAVEEPTKLTFSTPVVLPPDTPNFQVGSMAFTIVAYQNGQSVPGFTFAQPVTLTITYADADVEGLDEAFLTLSYFDPVTATWSGDGITVLSRDPAHNTLVVSITHLTLFAVGEERVATYLPAVMR